MRPNPLQTRPLTAFLLLTMAGTPCLGANMNYRLPVSITGELSLAKTPIDPVIDFNAVIQSLGVEGVPDLNSIRVIDLATGGLIPHALSEEFAHGNAGRVQWVVDDPTHDRYEVRFAVVDKRPALQPAQFTPMIGTGDLLRYNAEQPRPIALAYLSRLVDLTGDGLPDLVGCWNYAHRPGLPWDGIFCHPRVGGPDKFEFGDPVRIRYVEQAGSREFRHFARRYMHADFADLNGDGLVDIVFSGMGDDHLRFYLNSGQRDDGGMPVFVAAGSIPRQTSAWGPCRAVDLNNDGAVDLFVGGQYLRNTNPDGWPIRPAEAVTLDTGLDACFMDIDGDGLLDAVCLMDGPEEEPRAYTVAWRRNLGGEPPQFGEPQPLQDIDPFWCSYLAAVTDGRQAGLLVQHNVWQEISFYAHAPSPDAPATFRKVARAQSTSAVLSLSDQAWPFMCDWDGDGDLDLLVGGGYGWPRIVINEGTRDKPAYAEARLIEADGEPIRILRDKVFGGKHWHNMGYPLPAYVDWDGDGLPDLILPNETNRIFWYKNIGTRREPRFGPRQQVICDGYPESQEALARSASLSGDKSVPNNPYPYEEGRPFFWRTGAGFADLNGDGLMDMVTHDGHTRKLTLFTQHRDQEGLLRLRKAGPLTLRDGTLIDDAIVNRAAHWTESFRCVDWDGDGLVDIIYSCAGQAPSKGSIYLLRNCGTKSEPIFEPPVTLCCFGKPIHVTSHGPHPWVGDLSGDGKPDILTCVEWSVYPYYSHAAIMMDKRPDCEVGAARAVEAEG